MEPNNELGSGMFSGISSGFLGVDHNNPLHHQQSQPNQQQQQQQNPHHMQQPQMIPFCSSHHDTDTHQQFQHHQQPINKHDNYPPFSAKNKHQQQASLSDEDDQGFTADDTLSGDPNKRKNTSPWQRMKWTDTMVRLLIMAVYYIGDEGGSSEVTDPNGKKTNKPPGLLQKKGKWKSVSRAMMEKGFCVSPQQCEDKFNDLNKRYKRVNDILGKGTACKVVENQKLLDTMDHLSPKMKEEVRKLLNSKHLFFREMCAYHNSCGHGANPGSSAPQKVEVGSDVSQQHQEQQQQQQQEQQQRCSHSPEDVVANLGVLKVGCGEEDHEDDEEEEEEDESEYYSDEDEDESGEGGSRGQGGGNEQEDDHEDNENNDHGIRSSGNNKRPRKASPSSVSSQLMQQLSSEVNGVFQDGGKSLWEKKQWVRSRLLQMEEQQVSYQGQAFELEKQRLKWARFSSKKEREMERAKLENEKRRLENERMVLLIRQKELELLNLQQQQQHSST